MEYTILYKEEAKFLKGFVPEDILEGFFDGTNRYAICLTKENKLCGMGVFDVGSILEIVDISVDPEYRGRLEAKVVDAILKIFGELPCEAVRMDIYDTPDDEETERVLKANGFLQTGYVSLYRFPMSDLYDNLRFCLVTSYEGVISLAEASERQKKSFSNMLIKNGLFEGFLREDIDGEISTVYIQDGDIMGCVLITIPDEASFYVEYIYADRRAKKHALSAMMQESSERLVRYFDDERPDGFVLATNQTAYRLVKKTLPNAYVVESIKTYIN